MCDGLEWIIEKTLGSIASVFKFLYKYLEDFISLVSALLCFGLVAFFLFWLPFLAGRGVYRWHNAKVERARVMKIIETRREAEGEIVGFDRRDADASLYFPENEQESRIRSLTGRLLGCMDKEHNALMEYDEFVSQNQDNLLADENRARSKKLLQACKAANDDYKWTLAEFYTAVREYADAYCRGEADLVYARYNAEIAEKREALKAAKCEHDRLFPKKSDVRGTGRGH